jgi:3-(methylthio)propanoyl-CoA dehydrogenase
MKGLEFEPINQRTGLFVTCLDYLAGPALGETRNMLQYTAPLRDIRFSLDLVGSEELTKLTGFEHADTETVVGLLDEFGRMITDVWSPTNETGDREGLKVDMVTSTITTPSGFRDAYQAYAQAGWAGVALDPQYGGGGFPHLTGIAMSELLESANMALALCPMLTQGSIDALHAYGSEFQKETYLRKLISGEWSGTMNLTEPDAGSDVGALRAKAVQAADGTWRITGQKIYITWGEHDMADNIIHLVLARVDGSPAGTKGISCFIVPKFLVNSDGSLGERNDVRVVSTEHKMGIHASPTCVLAFGDNGEGAVGELIGEIDGGMRTMFVMMNNARLAVGQQGLALAERAYQHAINHSLTRVQGRPVGGALTDPIVGHPDIRRMLLTMRSQIEAMRHLVFLNAKAIDEARHGLTAEQRLAGSELADILTPLSKAWCTDLGNELCSLAVQIHGGMGFCEDTGVAQLYRDIRIAAIYEGTNGIQALDLYGRKLGLRGGAAIGDLIARMRADVHPLSAVSAVMSAQLTNAIDTAEQLTKWMLNEGRASATDGMSGATPYLRVMATVVGGWLMGRQATAAHSAAMDADPDGYLSAKVSTSAFYLHQILSTIDGLTEQITSGATELFAVPAELLASR